MKKPRATYNPHVINMLWHKRFGNSNVAVYMCFLNKSDLCGSEKIKMTKKELRYKTGLDDSILDTKLWHLESLGLIKHVGHKRYIVNKDTKNFTLQNNGNMLRNY